MATTSTLFKGFVNGTWLSSYYFYVLFRSCLGFIFFCCLYTYSEFYLQIIGLFFFTILVRFVLFMVELYGVEQPRLWWLEMMITVHLKFPLTLNRLLSESCSLLGCAKGSL